MKTKIFTLILLSLILFTCSIAYGQDQEISLVIQDHQYYLYFNSISSDSELYVVINNEYFPALYNKSSNKYYYIYSFDDFDIKNDEVLIHYIVIKENSQYSKSYTIKISVPSTNNIFSTDIFTFYIPLLVFTLLIIIRYFIPHRVHQKL